MNNKPNFKKPMTDREIKIVCMRLNIPLIGVFMDDELKDRPLKDGNYVINLEPSHLNGSHWTCFIKKGDEIFYYDPFGVYPDEPLHQNWLTNGYSIRYNDTDYQYIESILCGWFCISFFHYIQYSQGTPIKKMQNYFKLFDKHNTKKNDSVIKNYFSKLF